MFNIILSAIESYKGSTLDFSHFVCAVDSHMEVYFDLPFCDQLFAAFLEELKLIFPDLNHCFVGAGRLKQREMPLVITIVTSEKA